MYYIMLSVRRTYVTPHNFVSISLSQSQLYKNIEALVLILENNWDNTEAANTRCKKAEKNVGSSNKPECECVDSLIAIMFIGFSIFAHFLIHVKNGLIDSVHPNTTYIEININVCAMINLIKQL